jgi:hypothetical protein
MRPREESVRYRCNLPMQLAARIEAHCRDPLRPGKKSYGEFSRITAALWTKYLNEIAGAQSSHSLSINNEAPE